VYIGFQYYQFHGNFRIHWGGEVSVIPYTYETYARLSKFALLTITRFRAALPGGPLIKSNRELGKKVAPGEV